MKLTLRQLVNLTKNSRTKQNSLNLRKIMLKKHNIKIEDLLDTPIEKKLKEFEEG